MNLKQLQKTIETIASEHHVPAIQVSILKENQVIFKGGAGYHSLKKEEKINEKSIFSIGSATKAFAATAIGILVDDHLLHWDDPVKKYIPELQLFDDYTSQNITIRDLLCHRSGLPRHEYMWYLFSNQYSEAQLIEKLQYIKPSKPFRSYLQYQNQMYFLIGVIISRVTNKPWGDFVAERIFEPLGMEDSYCYLKDVLNSKNKVKPFAYFEDEIVELKDKDIDLIGTAGSINSTALDMTKWLEMNMNEGVYKGKRIISKESLKTCHSSQMVIDKLMPFKLEEISFSTYGLGWFIESYEGHKIIHHGGTIDGFKSEVALIPEKNMSFVILSSGDQNIVTWILQFIIYDMIFNYNKTDWNKKFKEIYKNISEATKEQIDQFLALFKEKKSIPVNLDAYVGTYFNAGYGEFTIQMMNDKLTIEFGSLYCELAHLSFNTFLIDSKTQKMFMPLQFKFDAFGNIECAEIEMEATTDEVMTFMKIS